MKLNNIIKNLRIKLYEKTNDPFLHTAIGGYEEAIILHSRTNYMFTLSYHDINGNVFDSQQHYHFEFNEPHNVADALLHAAFPPDFEYATTQDR